MKSLGELLARRKTDYELTFGTPHGKRVLADIARFGHALKTTMVEGKASAELEGRRQVFLRIRGFLDMQHEDIAAMIREEEEA